MKKEVGGMTLEISKILLVEDNQDHAELFVDILEAENIKQEVILIKDGLGAIDYFQEINNGGNGKVQHQVLLIVLDLNLPKVDGMKVLKYIKRSPDFCSIPVVILSTSSDSGTISEAYKNGASEYIVKPVSYDEFIERIRVLKRYL